jgi:hypothetical protein
MFVETNLRAVLHKHEAQVVWRAAEESWGAVVLCWGSIRSTICRMQTFACCVSGRSLFRSPTPLLTKMTSPWNPLDRRWDNVAGTWSWSLTPCVEMYLNARCLATCQLFFWSIQVEFFGTRDVNPKYVIMLFSPRNLVSEMRNWIKQTPSVHYFGVDVKVTHLYRLRIQSVVSSILRFWKPN